MNEPRVALITTTINIPKVLDLYRECDAGVRFFVAGDRKTPPEAAAFVEAIENATYISLDEQKGWQSAKWVNENCIQRRNFALLEALEWGADIIVSIDDDNAPLNTSYFDSYVARFAYPFSGPCVTGFNNWFDPGKLLVPPTSHRGFPHDIPSTWGIKATSKAKIGVCAGMCLGDPDISAITRIATGPIIHSISELARNGVVVDPHTRTVFNTQNVAFTREFAPAMLLVPQFKRFDDIIASLVCQRVMRDFDAYVHIGEPCVWQDRNPHKLLNDLGDELWGMRNIVKIAEWLDANEFAGASVLEKTLAIYESIPVFEPDAGVVGLARAWVEDCREAMA